MDIEKKAFEVSEESHKTLEEILEKAKEINTKVPRNVILKNIAELLERLGFEYKESQLLSDSLKTRGLDCKYFSVLYYSVAEELGLPLKIVMVPEHVFIRWDDENTTFNWETTAAEEQSDQQYIDRYNIHEESISKGVYLRSLTREETKAIAFNVRGIVKYTKGDIEGALEDFDRVIELNPSYVNTIHNRGITQEKVGKDRALTDYDRVIELDPNFDSAYSNRAVIRRKKGDFKGAIADLDKAIELLKRKKKMLGKRIKKLKKS